MVRAKSGQSHHAGNFELADTGMCARTLSRRGSGHLRSPLRYSNRNAKLDQVESKMTELRMRQAAAADSGLSAPDSKRDRSLSFRNGPHGLRRGTAVDSGMRRARPVTQKAKVERLRDMSRLARDLLLWSSPSVPRVARNSRPLAGAAPLAAAFLTRHRMVSGISHIRDRRRESTPEYCWDGMTDLHSRWCLAAAIECGAPRS
jgi:hypothetical protein